MKTDQYNHPDYYLMDDLLSEEHKLVRDSARAWVKKEVSPIIDEAYEKAIFPKHLIRHELALFSNEFRVSIKFLFSYIISRIYYEVIENFHLHRLNTSRIFDKSLN